MRNLIISTLLITACTSPIDCWAGKLSRARAAVRSNEPSTKDEGKKTSDGGGSKIKKARREVQSKPQHHNEDHHHHRSRRQRQSRGPSFGFSLSSWNPRPCTTPIIENHHHIYHTYPEEPAYTAPTYAAPVQAAPRYSEPAQIDPVRPSVVESFVRRFPPYPYAEGCEGCFVNTSPGYGHEWLGRMQFEFGSASDGVDRRGVGFLLENTLGFGLDFDWDTYSEELSAGEYDELHVGELNFLYRVAETDQLLMRAGIGVGWMGDRFDTDAGVNFTIKADYMPARPVVLSGELDFGTLGDAETLHAAGSIGAMLGPCEIYGGYDYRRIGNVEFEGPQIGFRFWF